MQDTKPSQTAAVVLKGQLFLNEKKITANLIDVHALALYRECLKEIDHAWLYLISFKGYQWIFSLFEKISIPGLFLHHFFRKKIIERWLLKAIDQKCQQVVIFAAGFDALTSMYFAKYPHIKFIEIDHPATQQVKNKAFERLNGVPKNVQFIECDLTQKRLLDVLSDSQVIDPMLKTYFVAEGFTMYVPQPSLEIFFQDIHHLFQDVWIAFSFMERQANGSIQFKQATFLTNLWLRIQKETFQWGIEPTRLQNFFLSPLHFEQVKLITTTKEMAKYGKMFQKHCIAEGEWLCLVRKQS